MKVITLDKLTEYISEKHGKQTIFRDNDNKKVFIYNAGAEHTDLNNVHCTLDFSHINDLNTAYPFIKSREAEAGALVIDGIVPKFDDLKGYTYKL